jgi:RimJ/RimL family protein N-acetyltransferase
LNDYVADPNLFPYKVVLIETQEVIGHCEFNYTNKFPRLSRILIANKARRGQRFGERMIRKMAVFFFEDTSIDQVDLNVFAFNSAALRCYEKVGFEINPEISVDVPVNGKSWHCLNMILKRDNLR